MYVFFQLAGRFATEMVADVIFGVTANALSEDIDSTVLKMGQRFISNFAYINSYFVSTGILPFLKKIYKFQIMRQPELNFFKGLIRDSMKLRGGGQGRDDYLQFLMSLKDKKGLNITKLTAYAMVFYLEGYDTCSVAMANLLQDVRMFLLNFS